MNSCICIICLKPSDVWINFLKSFVSYDIYIIIDDNANSYNDIYKDTNVHFIQIVNEECEKNGFVNVSYVRDKKVSGWEKALYYFSMMNTKYTNIWFLEDDVFFYNEQTLVNIDSKYGNSDLLSNVYDENLNGDKYDWYHWHKIYTTIKIPPPYYKTMCCAVRVSQTFLYKIKDYAINHGTLFYLEALFPTLCKQNNLLYHTPDELKYITWADNYTVVDKDNVYHPIKDMNTHKQFRLPL